MFMGAWRTCGSLDLDRGSDPGLTVSEALGKWCRASAPCWRQRIQARVWEPLAAFDNVDAIVEIESRYEREPLRK